MTDQQVTEFCTDATAVAESMLAFGRKWESTLDSGGEDLTPEQRERMSAAVDSLDLTFDSFDSGD